MAEEKEKTETEADSTQTPEERADQEIKDALAGSTLREKQRLKKKRYFKWALWAAGAAFVAYAVYWLFKPTQLSMRYGVCRVFLDLQVRYPEELQLFDVIDFSDSVRIWYVRLDPFGEYRMEQIQCFYEVTEMGTQMTRITIDRRDVDEEKVAAFNQTIPAILANPPDLTIRNVFLNRLATLDFSNNPYRRPLF